MVTAGRQGQAREETGIGHSTTTKVNKPIVVSGVTNWSPQSVNSHTRWTNQISPYRRRKNFLSRSLYFLVSRVLKNLVAMRNMIVAEVDFLARKPYIYDWARFIWASNERSRESNELKINIFFNDLFFSSEGSKHFVKFCMNGVCIGKPSLWADVEGTKLLKKIYRKISNVLGT